MWKKHPLDITEFPLDRPLCIPIPHIETVTKQLLFYCNIAAMNNMMCVFEQNNSQVNMQYFPCLWCITVQIQIQYSKNVI